MMTEMDIFGGGGGGSSFTGLTALVPYATSDTTSEGTIIYSSQYSSEKASSAFSAPVSASQNWSTLSNTFPAWIGFQFNTAKAVKGVFVLPRYLASYAGWKCKIDIEASNDGSNWFPISSDVPDEYITSSDNYIETQPLIITLNNSQAYTHWRVKLSDGVSYGTGNQANICIAQIQFYG